MVSEYLDWRTIVLLVTSFVYFGLTILVLTKSRRRFGAVAYGIFLATIFLWTLSLILHLLISPIYGGLFIRMLFVVSTFIVPAFLIFTHQFPFNNKVSHLNLFFVLSGIFIITLFIFSDFLITGEIIVNNYNKDKFIVLGSGYALFVFYMVSGFIYGIFRLARKYKRHKGIVRKQLQYILLGVAISSSIALYTNLVALWHGNQDLYWFGPVAVLLLVIFTTYTIFQHRFLDITLFFGKALSIAVFALVGVVLYGLLFFIMHTLFSLDISLLSFALGVGGLLPPLILLSNFKTMIDTNYLVSSRVYDHSKALSDITHKLTQANSVELVSQAILPTFDKLFQPGALYLLIRQEQQSSWLYAQQHAENKFTDVPDDRLRHINGLIAVAAKCKAITGNIIFTEELRYRLQNKDIAEEQQQVSQQVLDCLDALTLAAVVTIDSPSPLRGYILMGAKPHQKLYTTQDRNFLLPVSQQLSVAFSNIFAYTQLAQHAEHLRQSVEEATARLSTINEKQAQLLFDIAHELQSPLVIIQGNLELLKKEQAVADDQVVPPLMAAQRLSRLISNVLLLARSDFGHLALQKELHNISQLLAQSVDDMCLLAKQKRIAVSVDGLTTPCVRQIDAVQMRSVFDNLLHNAVKYTNSGGEIRVTLVQSSDGSAHMCFYNSSQPIPEADLQTMFDRFYRRLNDAGQASGTGIGLAIVKQIVDEHGGSVVVRNVSGGVEFEVAI